MPTKAQLESEVENLKIQLKNQKEELLGKLGLVNAESSKLKSDLIRATNEADRQLANANQADMKLKSICRVIASTLAVKYETGPGDAFDTPNKDRQPEEVRFLRHLFELADTSVPF